MSSNFAIRSATAEDLPALLDLFKVVAQQKNGIIRSPKEVTEAYVQGFLMKSIQKGLILVFADDDKIYAEIHAYQLDTMVFRHLLTELTIVVHPDYQGKGVGKAIFNAFLKKVKEDYPHILRVELYVREKNKKAYLFYSKLGFREEGRHTNQIFNLDGTLETPISMAWTNPNFNPKHPTT